MHIDGPGDGFCIAVALLIIYFAGDPDLHDLVQALVRQVNG